MPLTIAQVRIEPLNLHFRHPLHTASGEFHERHGVRLTLVDEQGLEGRGEAAPWPGFGTESVAEAETFLRYATRGLPGQAIDPTAWPEALSTLLTHAPAARAALAGALWELSARVAAQSLAAHLVAHLGPFRGSPLMRVPVHALLTDDEPDALLAAAARARIDGYRAIKLKLGGRPWREDVERMQAARAGLGPGLALRGDANGAWDRASAAQALAALAGCTPEFIEQPLPAEDLEGLAALRRSSQVPVAADESVAICGVQAVLTAGSADALVLKPSLQGGLVAALEAARAAAETGVGVIWTHAFEGAIGAHHALHVAAAWGIGECAHGLATAGVFEDDSGAPAARGGWITVPDGPGLGCLP
jgi:o-succinylbenzoate synthase